jgi:hypothetical protein
MLVSKRAKAVLSMSTGVTRSVEGILDHSVLECRYPYRPRLAIVLRDVDSSDWLMPVLFGLQPRVQTLQVFL